jgi:hypothetical protein
VIDIIVAEAALDAQIAMIYGGIEGRCDLVYKLVFDMQFKCAAYAAIRAGGGDFFIGVKHGCSSNLKLPFQWSGPSQ